MADVGWPFAVLVSMVAGCCVARLAAALRTGRAWRGEVPHIVEGLGMAVMLAPAGPGLPRPWSGLVFAAVAAWSAPLLLQRNRTASGHAGPHSVTGGLAMAYMLAIPAMTGPHMTGPPTTGMAMPSSGGIAALNAVLALYFVAEAAWAGHSLATMTGGEGNLLLVAPQINVACHMALGVVMGYVFLTMA